MLNDAIRVIPVMQGEWCHKSGFFRPLSCVVEHSHFGGRSYIDPTFEMWMQATERGQAGAIRPGESFQESRTPTALWGAEYR